MVTVHVAARSENHTPKWERSRSIDHEHWSMIAARTWPKLNALMANVFRPRQLKDLGFFPATVLNFSASLDAPRAHTPWKSQAHGDCSRKSQGGRAG